MKLSSMVGWVQDVNRSPGVVDVVRRFRRVLPGDPTFGDPLSLAGEGSALAVARVADKFRGDEPGATREIGLGALQVWQAVLERTGRGRGERDVTIVFTDLVGFSSWSLVAGDAATLTLLRKVSQAVEPAVAAGGGHVVKRLGDGIMAVFYRPDQALEAVVAARTALSEVDVDGYTPTMRVGIHTGNPRQIGSDWLGVDVTIAARVMQTGGNGNLMISRNAFDAVHPDTVDALGLVPRPYRRGFFAPKLTGVPEDLKILRLVRHR
ncbi:adenylate/guanylate cyclase domain-containing protein [Rhodococcus sp. 14-2470-1a]|nr:adenylate/guanylate cyclase domain-containing protein [Rhodococcus sp. 06-621-2]OZD15245.1 adenylate/guanylate cyclase domain-containing protein [Rhodococcus sp. 06-156-4C]OZD19667.1 adenylate/guanylate cyclase domain-containing protein [Rhodococcus sp. 06-156-4a]OZD23022.1 adenylate/guanylate cyclase domain-containing protein [Rhodococcus sp. 06-156-3C]OZD25685.1 adenylate/guanylate cyclase domain-containing protein [Rhodococcus sp. 06-156-3b]OZD37892.1 adenylate/guanylate cyclase domain-c